jgi:spoIIIJ-associated protein
VKQVTATAQTVNEAVESALKELNTTKEKTEIQVVDEGKKGFLGLFGSRPAIVKVTVKHDPLAEAKQFIENIAEKMGAEVHVHHKQEGKVVTFELSGEKIAMLIGKRGQTLNSLQYLTQLVVNKNSTQYLTIMLDAEDYRSRRNEALVNLSEKMANKAIYTKKEVSLEPMPSFERKVIHTALMNNKKVKTYSAGTEPHRHIVISPNK